VAGMADLMAATERASFVMKEGKICVGAASAH
jgi:hypothetical protein